MPVAPGLSNPTTLLFNRPVRCLMPRLNRAPINHDFDEDHLNALKCVKTIYNKDTVKEIIIISSGSTVAVQCKDNWLWTHGTISEHGNANYNGWLYGIQATKTGHIITRHVKHLKEHPS